MTDQNFPADTASDLFLSLWDEKARRAYDTYGASVGWKNYAGAPMPQWPEIPRRIRAAWCYATQAVYTDAQVEASVAVQTEMSHSGISAETQQWVLASLREAAPGAIPVLEEKPKAKVRMIVAYNSQGIIGKDNKIPWFFKGDLKFFKDQTMGGVVIMGRKTWESLPPKMRPLPGRVNIVITSKSPAEIGVGKCEPLPGNDTLAAVAWNLGDALTFANDFFPDKDIWIIGGASVYAEGMKVAQEVVVTDVVNHDLEDTTGAVYFPKWTEAWQLTSTTPHPECPDLAVSRWTRKS